MIKKIKKQIKKIKKKKKSVKRRRKNKKITMEEIYKILNRAQFAKKEQIFSVNFDDAETIENIIKDLQLKYNRNNLKTKVNFIIYPSIKNHDEANDVFDDNSDESNIYKLLDLEPLSDEIIEDGQCF